MNWIEWIGYAASLGIMISMLMTSVLKLRLINLAGCVLFIVYGWLIGSYPVAVVNFFIAIINIFYLHKMINHSQTYFSVMAVEPENSYIKKFLEFYASDIQKYVPGFHENNLKKDECWILLRDMKVAGVFLGSKQENHILQIELDYILPEYRDFQTGKYLYEKNKDLFLKKSYTQLIVEPGTRKHNKYLKKMGFRPHQGRYQRSQTS